MRRLCIVWRTLVLALVLLLALGVGAPANGQAIKELVVGQSIDHLALEIYFAIAVPSQSISYHMLEPLVMLDDSLTTLKYRLHFDPPL